MKKFVLIIAVCSVLFPLNVHAQFVRLEKYPDIPVEFEAAFVDQVTSYVSGVVKSLYGQYFGQLSPEGNIYGYGSFYTDMDGEVYGLYRNGDLAFGIKKGAEIAKVGTNDHYVAYDLRTGYPVYIMKNNQKYNPSTDMREKNKFLVLTYPSVSIPAKARIWMQILYFQRTCRKQHLNNDYLGYVWTVGFTILT